MNQKKQLDISDELVLVFTLLKKCARSLMDKADDPAAMNILWANQDNLSCPCSIHGGRFYYKNNLYEII